MQVDINLSRPAADLITEFGAGAKIYLYSAATSGGSYSAVGSGTLLVSGTERYEVIDSAGTPGTTWYKFRVGNTGATAFTDYSDPWLSTSLVAYATLDDLRETLALGTAVGHDNLLTDLLVDVSEDITTACFRSFYRDPQVSGDVTVYFDVECPERSLAASLRRPYTIDGRALDIVSVTNLYVRDDESSAYREVLAGDTGYYLEAGDFPGQAGTDWPYVDITLSPVATDNVFPRGKRAVKLVGALGFPKVPKVVKRATVSEARERFRQSIGGGPAQIGVTAFGSPIFLTGDSPDLRRLMRWPYSRKQWVS